MFTKKKKNPFAHGDSTQILSLQEKKRSQLMVPLGVWGYLRARTSRRSQISSCFAHERGKKTDFMAGISCSSDGVIGRTAGPKKPQ